MKKLSKIVLLGMVITSLSACESLPILLGESKGSASIPPAVNLPPEQEQAQKYARQEEDRQREEQARIQLEQNTKAEIYYKDLLDAVNSDKGLESYHQLMERFNIAGIAQENQWRVQADEIYQRVKAREIREAQQREEQALKMIESIIQGSQAKNPSWSTLKSNLEALQRPEYLNSKAMVDNMVRFKPAKAKVEQFLKSKAASIYFATEKLIKSSENRVTGRVFYDHLDSPSTLATKVETYLGVSASNVPQLRIRFQYYGTDWIFLQGVQARCNNKIYQMSFDYFEIDRENSSRSVWETYDVPAVGKYDQFIQCAAKHETVINFLGSDGMATIDIPEKQRNAMGDMRLLRNNWSNVNKETLKTK